MADNQPHIQIPETDSVEALKTNAIDKVDPNVQVVAEDAATAPKTEAQLHSNSSSTEEVQAPKVEPVNKADHKERVVATDTTPEKKVGWKAGRSRWLHVSERWKPLRQGSPKEEWLTSSLHWMWMISLILIQTCLIAAIFYLARKSTSQNGILSIPQESTLLISSYFSISNVWIYGLLWTTLPTQIMTIYNMMWQAIVSAVSSRQPFIDLKQSATPPDSTLRLKVDYTSYPSILAWAVVLGDGHIHLGIPMLLGWVLSIAIVPLTAHLIVAAPSQSSSSVALSFTSSFNESALTPSTSLQPALDLATANRIYGATPPSWMTLEFAFEAFEVGNSSTQAGNVTAETNGYSAQLDCQTFPPESATYTASTTPGFGTIQFNTTDRGCEVSGVIEVNTDIPNYISSWQNNCAGSDEGRIGIIAGIYSEESPIKLTNYSLISCTIWYWNTSGSIEVSLRPGASPQFTSFRPSSSISFHPSLYYVLESSLHRYSIFDTSGTFSSDAFGFAVYSYAQAQNPASFPTPDLIKNCTQDLWRTLYAGLAVQTLLQNNDAPPAGAGQLSTPVTRLYVVTPIAYTIGAVLALALVCNVWLLYYTYTNHTGLSEEPFTLIGKDGVLNQRHKRDIVATYWKKDVYLKLLMNNKILCYGEEGAASVEREKGEA